MTAELEILNSLIAFGVATVTMDRECSPAACSKRQFLAPVARRVMCRCAGTVRSANQVRQIRNHSYHPPSPGLRAPVQGSPLHSLHSFAISCTKGFPGPTMFESVARLSAVGHILLFAVGDVNSANGPWAFLCCLPQMPTGTHADMQKLQTVVQRVLC